MQIHNGIYVRVRQPYPSGDFTRPIPSESTFRCLKNHIWCYGFIVEDKGKLWCKGQIPAPSWGLVQSKWTGKVPALYQ